MKIIQGSAAFEGWLLDLKVRRNASNAQARNVARSIIEGVRTSGDREVVRLLREIDGIDLPAASISQSTFASPQLDASLVAAIETAIERVERFHAPQTQSGYAYEEGDSSYALRVRPYRRVGVYVPGGRAVYLSTLIMCAVPARLAGVKEIVVATTPHAAAEPALQFLFTRLGVAQVYRCGGPAGVAALALGTESLQRVDKIVGPGSAFVTAAKELLFGAVGLDMTAGPTEIVIVCDRSTDLTVAAADLLAQAEHGVDSVPVVVTDSPGVARELEIEVDRQLGELAGAAAVALRENGVIVVVESIGRAVDVINAIGPEHVSIQCHESSIDIDEIADCGAVFIGRYSPVAIGDYVAGSNHVLPTAGAGRFFSPLGVYDFYKRSSVVRLGAGTFAAISAAGELLAEREGLPLHAKSIALREQQPAGAGARS